MRLRCLLPIAAMMIAATGCQKSASDTGKTASSAEADAPAFGEMTIDQVSQKMDEAKAGKAAFFVFDNNQKEVFDKGHVPSAKWLKFDEVKASDLPADKEATLVFYCANEH